jgi:glutamyl-tRNA reductase
MGSLAAHAAANAGAAVTVANRTPEPARLLAEATHGRSVELDPGPGLVAAAGVIVALGAPWTIDDRTAAALVDSGALVVDLSFPSAISPALAAALGDRLVTSDDVAIEEVEGAAASPRLLARLEHLVDASVAEFVEWHGRSDARALADALATRADAERRRELDALWRRLPSLGPDDREAIEEMTRHLASRLLREPLQRLGRDPNGPDGSVIRDLFAL